MPTTNALQNYRIVGFDVRHYQATPDAPKQPGASCDYCGTAIVNCVLIQERTTGERMVIGTDCAERVGLDAAQVKALMDARYAEIRAEQRAAEADARRAAAAIREAELAGTLGAHGTAERFAAGCQCPDCLAAAPHGTQWKFREGACVCGLCLDYALAQGFTIISTRVIVDLRTGLVLDDARIVDGRYGTQFRSDSADVWAPFTPPARRTTAERKGVTYAEAEYLVRQGRRGTFRAARLSSPIVDQWGEAIERHDWCGDAQAHAYGDCGCR